MDTNNRPNKRQFQRDITTYFRTHEPNNTSTRSEKATASFPGIPATIQSSLLNVGMRVRKSVPEGYKTERSTYLPSTTQSNSRTSSSGYAELVPYCGMIKVGGYESQPKPTAADAGCDLYLEEDVFANELSVDDSSPAATVTETRSGAKKRRFRDDQEINFFEILGDASLRSMTSSPLSMALRPIAQARHRRSVVTDTKGTENGDFEEATFLRDLKEHMEF